MIGAALALFVVTLGFGVVIPLLPSVAGDASHAVTSFSAVFAGYNLARIASQLPSGVWVDRAGPVTVLRLALGLYALSLAGFLVDGGLAWFTSVRVLEGAATGMTYPAVLAIAARGAPETMGKRIGAVVGGGSSGVLVGPLLAVVLPARGAIGVALVAAIALAGWFVVAARDTLVEEREKRTLRGEVAALARIGRDPAFAGLLLPLTFNKVTFSGFQALLPLWGPAVLGIGIRGVAALFGLAGLIFALVQPLAGRAADRVDARILIVALAGPLLAVLAVLGRSDDPVTFTLLYTGYIVLTSTIFAATVKHAGKSASGGYGSVFGIVSTATDLGTIAGPILFLSLYDGARNVLFPIVAACGVPFALGFLVLAFRSPKPAKL